MKIGLKVSIFLPILFLCCSQIQFAQSESMSAKIISLDKKLHIGDEFTYIVKYAFLNLGEVRTKVYDKDTLDGKIIYKAIAYIDSYDGLPFVTIHQVYESWFDTTLQPVFFKALIYDENDTSYTKYYFSDNNAVHIKKGKLNLEKTSMDTIVSLQQKYQDGLSIMYYARFMLQSNNLSSIPCFINENTSVTEIAYFDEEESISIDNIDYDIDCFMIEGHLGFTGIFGLTGNFRGWFSNDGFNIPISAELQVLIGNISIELINWKKSRWLPPASD
jgi:hypothetical protein